MKAIILSAGADTGGVGHQLKLALERHTGWAATQVVRSLNYIAYPRDVLWPIGEPMPDALFVAFREADVVHAMESWDACRAFPGWMDKPLVLHHHGSVFRAQHAVLTRGAIELRAERIVSTPDLLLIDPGAEWLPSPIDADAMRLLRADGLADRHGEFTAFHSPTNRQAKGSQAFEAAAAEAGVPLDLAEGVPWDEALRRKARADIVLDQLALGYGLAGLEAMAMGIPVVSGASDPDGTMRSIGVPGGPHLTELLVALWGYLPYLSATPETLADRIAELRDDDGLRFRVARMGRYHAERWHGFPSVAQQLAQVYERAIGAKR